MKKLPCLMTLLLVLLPIAGVAAQTATYTEKAKKDVERLGVGAKARATVIRHDGTKVKGYVYSVSDDEFVIHNSKTDAPTTIRFADVAKIEDKRDDTAGKLTGLFLVGGLAGILAVLYGAGHSNR